MAQFVYEFFRPWGEPALYPLGVLAQDKEAIAYGEIEGVQIPDSFKSGFFQLSDRGAFIADQLLPRLGVADKTDPELFDVLRNRATHRFLYSDVAEKPGSAADVVAAEVERLRDPTALGALEAQFAALATVE